MTMNSFPSFPIPFSPSAKSKYYKDPKFSFTRGYLSVYSTVTDLAKFLGTSTFSPSATASQ